MQGQNSESSVTLKKLLISKSIKDVNSLLDLDTEFIKRMEEKTNQFPPCPVIRMFNMDVFTSFMLSNILETHASQTEKVCDWTDRQKYLVQYRMFMSLVRYGMIILNVISVKKFRPRQELESYI